MQKSLKSIYVPSIPIKLFVRERKWWSLIFFRHQYFSWKKNVYRKKTFSGVYSNFNSFIPESYKTGLIESLLFRCFNLCSDFVKFNDEINIFKSILYKNSNPRDLVDKKFLDRVSTQKVVESTVPKMDLMIVLPYLGKFSLQIPTRINRVMKNKLPQKINLQVDQFLHIHRLLFISAVAAMLPIMAKLSAILKSECVNILDFLLLLEREWKGITILP